MDSIKQFTFGGYDFNDIWDFDFENPIVRNFIKESNLSMQDMQEIKFIIKDIAYKVINNPRTQEFNETAQERFNNEDIFYDCIDYFKEIPFENKYLFVHIQLGIDLGVGTIYHSYISISDVSIYNIKKQLEDKITNDEHMENKIHLIFPSDNTIIL